MLGWAGLRGATPIVFATFPVTANLPEGELIFNVAFFAVLVSTVLQGTTIEPVARFLGVTSDEASIPEPLVEPVLLNRLGAEVVQFPVRESDAVVGHPVRELGLPREALPSRWLAEKLVWEALLEAMPMEAMVRNIATRPKVLGALLTYQAGHGARSRAACWPPPS